MTRTIQIAPSILSADFTQLARDIARVEAGGADILHLDVMDGHFVPNITIGPPVISWIRKCTDLPLDTHLMIKNPAQFIDSFARAGVNWLSVHVEEDVHLDRTIHQIQQHDIKAGVVLNPATPLSAVTEVLPIVDFVLVMSVNPGFSGQSFIPYTLEKIRKLRAIIDDNDYRAAIEVDGGVGLDNLKSILEAGAEIVVSGSAVFSAEREPGAILRQMREIADF